MKFTRLISLMVLLVFAMSLLGCGQTTPTSTGTELKKVKLGYSGGACEAFLFSAYEKGFFKEQGLDVELVKVDFETLKESLATNKIQGSSGMVMKLVKPFEQGIDAAFAAGIHTGCIQLLVPKNSTIKTVADLKGKTIANNAMGDGPMIFAARALAAAGIDYKSGVQWKSYPPNELEGVLDRGEADAIVLSDPFAQLIIDKGKAVKLLNTTEDEPYKSEYCCMATISGQLYRDDPQTAAAIAKGMMQGAKWVSEHQDEVAQMMVEKKYVPGDPALIAKLLKSYNYIPSVEGGEQAVDRAVTEMKALGVLDPNTSAEEFKKKVFIHLQGL